jgi:hypothetical protein
LIRLIILFIFLPAILFSQEKGLYFFPSLKIFNPVNAAVFESRVGATKFISKDDLKLDIGASADIIGFSSNVNETYSLGADFFTFSSLRAEKNFKFPVDAIDYFFGINFNMIRKIDKDFSISGRIRFSHISAHLQDGHLNKNILITPFTYSREFIEMNLLTENILQENLQFKNQLGLIFIFHSIPADVSKLTGQYGVEMRYLINKTFSLYFSDELRYTGLRDKNYFSNNLETGITLGGLRSRAVNIFFTYYDGRDYRGQYYSDYLNYKGIGFNIKL